MRNLLVATIICYVIIIIALEEPKILDKVYCGIIVIVSGFLRALDKFCVEYQLMRGNYYDIADKSKQTEN